MLTQRCELIAQAARFRGRQAWDPGVAGRRCGVHLHRRKPNDPFEGPGRHLQVLHAPIRDHRQTLDHDPPPDQQVLVTFGKAPGADPTAHELRGEARAGHHSGTERSSDQHLSEQDGEEDGDDQDTSADQPGLGPSQRLQPW